MPKLNFLLAFTLIYLVMLASTSTVNTVQAENINTYGPIKSGDMLWNIAAKVSPSSISRHQAILALHRINPHAFRVSCNINSLKVGGILRIPSLLEMQTLSRAEATQELNRQNNEWKNRRQKSIVCPPVVIPPLEPTTPPVTESADNTQPPKVEPADEQPSELGPSVPLSGEASDALKSTTTETSDSDSPPAKPETVVDNIQPVIPVSDDNTENASQAANENTPSFQVFSSTMIILLITIAGLFIAILIAWLLHKYAKRKASESETIAYNFPEPIKEMPYHD